MKLTGKDRLILLALLIAVGAALVSAVQYEPFAGAVPARGLIRAKVVEHVEVEASDKCSHCHLARHKSPLVGPCEDCHTTGTWESFERSHETTTMDAPSHDSLRCVQCHTSANKLPVAECKSCHTAVAHRWEPDCKRCHAVTVWTEVNLREPSRHVERAGRHERLGCPDCHAFTTAKKPPVRCKECHSKHTAKFPLTGPHKKPACVKCHRVTPTGDNFNVVAIKAGDCAQCHKIRHRGYSKCADCHKTKFEGTPYDHAREWPLTGEHARVGCSACHADLQWEPLPSKTCSACHRVRHTGLNDCARCHTTASFEQPRFDHAEVFPLVGPHASAPCARCHPGDDYGRSRGTTCVQCHGSEHGGLTGCASCHQRGSFLPSTFRHDRVWEKTGAHAGAPCTACHPKKRFAAVRGTSCRACHGLKHSGQRDCETCHQTTAWSPVRDDIVHTPKYPLFGQHRSVDCRSCHKDLRFEGTPNRCIDCHASLAHEHDHPNCERCHVPRSWSIILPHDMGDCE